jgi:hypothetical protein
MRAVAHPGRTAAVGTSIALYATFDSLISGVPIAALAALLPPLIVFGAAAALLTLLNIACCNWVERQWVGFVAGNAKRLEAKLDKMRKSPVMRHPVAWITRGSDAWYSSRRPWPTRSSSPPSRGSSADSRSANAASFTTRLVRR